jgi:hypothetical protein
MFPVECKEQNTDSRIISSELELSQLTIYFSIHSESYPEPLLDARFQDNFRNCNTFIMENAEQWQTKCCDLESQYNRLSNNAIGEIIPCQGKDTIEQQLAALPPSKFEKALRDTIRCKERSIILERSPVPYLKIEEYPGKLQFALETGLEGAVELCKKQLLELAANMKQRDDALLDLICKQLKGNAKVFVFRGGAHEKYLNKLLDERKILFTPVRFCQPTLEERVLFPLTIGEQFDETDVLRWLYVQVNRQNGDFEKLRTLMEEAEVMDKKRLESKLTALSDRRSTSGLD